MEPAFTASRSVCPRLEKRVRQQAVRVTPPLAHPDHGRMGEGHQVTSAEDALSLQDGQENSYSTKLVDPPHGWFMSSSLLIQSQKGSARFETSSRRQRQVSKGTPCLLGIQVGLQPLWPILKGCGPWRTHCSLSRNHLLSLQTPCRTVHTYQYTRLVSPSCPFAFEGLRCSDS